MLCITVMTREPEKMEKIVIRIRKIRRGRDHENTKKRKNEETQQINNVIKPINKTLKMLFHVYFFSYSVFC